MSGHVRDTVKFLESLRNSMLAKVKEFNDMPDKKMETYVISEMLSMFELRERVSRLCDDVAAVSRVIDIINGKPAKEEKQDNRLDLGGNGRLTDVWGTNDENGIRLSWSSDSGYFGNIRATKGAIGYKWDPEGLLLATAMKIYIAWEKAGKPKEPKDEEGK